MVSQEAVKLGESTTDFSNLRKLAFRRIDFTIIDRMVDLNLLAENRAELEGKIEEAGTVESVDVDIFFNRTARVSKIRADFDRGQEMIRRGGSCTRIYDAWMNKF